MDQLKIIKFSLPNELTLLPTKCTLCPLFHSLPRPPQFFAQIPPFFAQPSTFARPPAAPWPGSRAVETHWFRWKEINDLFTIAVTLLPRRTQPMTDNYRGRQSRTGGGTIYFTRPFQVPDTRTARGQHGPAARHGFESQRLRDSGPKPETQV